MKLISYYLLSLIYLADVSNLVLDNTGNDNNATLQTTSTTTTNNRYRYSTWRHIWNMNINNEEVIVKNANFSPETIRLFSKAAMKGRARRKKLGKLPF